MNEPSLSIAIDNAPRLSYKSAMQRGLIPDLQIRIWRKTQPKRICPKCGSPQWIRTGEVNFNGEEIPSVWIMTCGDCDNSEWIDALDSDPIACFCGEMDWITINRIHKEGKPLFAILECKSCYACIRQSL